MEIMNVVFLEKTYCDFQIKVLIYITLHVNDRYCTFF
jgi:hypothetical protein